FARPAESAIAKHEAWAAARSSSGLDFPPGASVRALHDTGSSLNFPLDAAVTTPVPLKRSPFQTARASLVAAMSHLPIAYSVRTRPRDGPTEGAPTISRRRALRYEPHDERLARALPRGGPRQTGHDRRDARLVRWICSVVPEHVQWKVADAFD